MAPAFLKPRTCERQEQPKRLSEGWLWGCCVCDPWAVMEQASSWFYTWLSIGPFHSSAPPQRVTLGKSMSYCQTASLWWSPVTKYVTFQTPLTWLQCPLCSEPRIKYLSIFSVAMVTFLSLFVGFCFVFFCLVFWFLFVFEAGSLYYTALTVLKLIT